MWQTRASTQSKRILSTPGSGKEKDIKRNFKQAGADEKTQAFDFDDITLAFIADYPEGEKMLDKLDPNRSHSMREIVYVFLTSGGIGDPEKMYDVLRTLSGNLEKMDKMEPGGRSTVNEDPTGSDRPYGMTNYPRQIDTKALSGIWDAFTDWTTIDSRKKARDEARK